MKRMSLAAGLWVGFAMFLGGGAPGAPEDRETRTWNFDKDAPGGLPRGFTQEVGEWRIAADETAPSQGQVLAQAAKSSGPTFNLALAIDIDYRDVELSVRMKAVAGEVDQGGGLVWRARNRDNYYIARYNPLEDNFRVYKVVDGKRTQLGSADVERAPGWREIQVTMQGDRIECRLDGKTRLDARDATFQGAGRIGLWTKADARTHFDDLAARPGGAPPGGDRTLDTAEVEKITGLSGSFNPEEKVFKVTSPRTDVQVTVDDWRMPPFLGLTSWAAFQAGTTAQAMVMGDIVLFEDEVNPVMSAALDAGLEVTALHNHFFHDQPKVYFMHIGGEGETAALARGVRKALDTVKSMRSETPAPRRSFGGKELPAKSAITARTVQDILGVQGQEKDGMLKVVLGRKVKLPCGCEIGKEMGVNTWAAFAGSDELAVVDGDFAVLEDELQVVLRSLRRAEINVVAIHHHLTHEEPRVLFLHYWGKGPLETLARGLRSTLDAQAQAAKPSRGR
jgi:hypothetical protein